MNGIKYFREKAQLTQMELAHRIGVSQKAVAKWEVGKSFPKASNLLKLSDTLNCSADELLRQDKENHLLSIIPTKEVKQNGTKPNESRW